ncbi:MAG TPA: hypothetical protein VN963_01090, partial [bacterium]|nr:hypothetical protein [bacterium]
MGKFFPLIFLGLFLRTSPLCAQLVSTGPSQQTIEQGVSAGIFDSMAAHAGDWVANGMQKIGNWALQTLFGIYDQYIGTFLI